MPPTGSNLGLVDKCLISGQLDFLPGTTADFTGVTVSGLAGIVGQSINENSDVDTATSPPSTNDLLRWDGTNWVPSNRTLANITDVEISSAADCDILHYDGVMKEWVNASIVSKILPFTAKGDLVTYTGSAVSILPVGTDNQILQADSSAANGLSWTNNVNGTLTTKGDILGYSNDEARVPVGTNGQVLTADSNEAIGVKYSTLVATKGDLLAYSTELTQLAVGADGTVLEADSAEATGLKWGTKFVSPLTTKGDLFTYDTADTRIGVGSDGASLVADSTTSTGLAWLEKAYIFLHFDNGAGNWSGTSGTLTPTATTSGVSFWTSDPDVLGNNDITYASGSPPTVTVSQTGTYVWSMNMSGRLASGASSRVYNEVRRNGTDGNDEGDASGTVMLQMRWAHGVDWTTNAHQGASAHGVCQLTSGDVLRFYIRTSAGSAAYRLNVAQFSLQRIE